MKNLTFVREGEGMARDPIYKFNYQLLLVNIRKCCFKFQQNRTINEDFGLLMEDTPFINCNLNYYWQTYENIVSNFRKTEP